MSSPVTGSDFVIASQNQSLCDRLTSLLGLTSKVKLWFDWAFDTNGDATTEFKAMFLPPPGTIVAYYLNAPEDAVKDRIEMIGRDVGDTGGPFWLLCDGANGATPDLRGRTIVGGGQGTGLTNRPVDGSNFGSETHTLGISEVPFRDHFHGVGARGVNGTGVTNNDALLLIRNWSGSGHQFHGVIGDGESPYNGSLTSGDLSTANSSLLDTAATSTVSGHNNIQPSMAIWYMMRTTRMA